MYSYLTVTNIYEIREKIILPALQTKKERERLSGSLPLFFRAFYQKTPLFSYPVFNSEFFAVFS